MEQNEIEWNVGADPRVRPAFVHFLAGTDLALTLPRITALIFHVPLRLKKGRGEPCPYIKITLHNKTVLTIKHLIFLRLSKIRLMIY